MGGWPPDENDLRAAVLRICAEGALIGENRCRPEVHRRHLAHLRPVLEALVAEGVIQRHDVGALTIYIAWPGLLPQGA
jgi:hypothetical protein